jgi:hypothetical protein
MIDGTPKFNSLAIRELAAEFNQMGQIKLTGKAAFVNQQGGTTHGWTRGEGAIWSQETIQRLQQLRESMEMDMGGLHFVGVNPSTFTAERPLAELGGPGGLGEHLDDSDQI